MADNEQPQMVRVQVLDLPGYVKGVCTRMSSRDADVLEKRGAIRKLKGDEFPRRDSLKGKADKKAAPANTK